MISDKGYLSLDMSMVFCFAAILFAILNVILSLKGRDARAFMFISLSFTAIMLCFAYDSIIGLERSLVLDTSNWFVVTIVLILINGISLLRKPRK